jgi:hypothetical protein
MSTLDNVLVTTDQATRLTGLADAHGQSPADLAPRVSAQ